MERQDIIPHTLSLDVENNNNTFSSFVDETLMMMPPLALPGQVEPSSSSWCPTSFHMPTQPHENDQIGDHGKKKDKRSRKVPRIEFHTRSDDDVLDDGYRWRKYGQKSVKNNGHPRYVLTHHILEFVSVHASYINTCMYICDSITLFKYLSNTWNA